MRLEDLEETGPELVVAPADPLFALAGFGFVVSWYFCGALFALFPLRISGSSPPTAAGRPLLELAETLRCEFLELLTVADLALGLGFLAVPPALLGR